MHNKVSLTHTIESTDKPLNCFQNYIVLVSAHELFHKAYDDILRQRIIVEFAHNYIYAVQQLWC